MDEKDIDAQASTIRNTILLALVAVVLLIWQTTIQTWMDPWGYGPDLSWAVIFYLGLYAPLVPGAITVTALGFISDAAGGGVFGLHAAVFLTIFLTTGLIRQKVDPRAPWYLMTFIFCFVLGGYLISALILYSLDKIPPFIPGTPLSPVVTIPLSIMSTSLFSPLLFWLLDFMGLNLSERMEREI